MTSGAARTRRGAHRVGPRSAVFAPLARPRPDDRRRGARAAYKHEGDPRYDARRVAAERARPGRRACCSPAARRRGRRASTRSARLALPERVDGRPLPPVEVLDMRDARHPLHPETREALGGRAQGDRAGQPPRLVELPLLPVVRARVEVPACDVALVLHRASARSPATTAATASACRSAATPAARSSVARHGAGTERIETELREALDVPVFRLDADTARRQGRRPALLERFEPRPRACSSARRWSPRATTSRTSRSASCSTPTRRCASPTSAPRSARSRSSRSSPGRAGRGPARRPRARADVARRTRPRSWPPRATTRDGFLAGELERRRALATRRSPT